MSAFLTDVRRSNPRHGRKPKKGHPWGRPEHDLPPPRPVQHDAVTSQSQHLVGTIGCYHTHVPSLEG